MQKIKFHVLFILLLSCLLYANQDTIKIDTDVWKASIIPSINMASFVQYDNSKPLKGFSLSIMKYYWYNEFKDAHEEGRVSNRNRAFWWSIFLYFYTVIDGYMDSKLDNHPKDIKQIEGE